MRKDNKIPLMARANRVCKKIGVTFDEVVQIVRTGALLKARTMNRDDVLPYLQRVQLPAAFPIPKSIGSGDGQAAA